MSNPRSSLSGKGWPPQGTITTFPSVGRFENEPPTTTLYTKGSPAKFTDNDGRKSIAPYSNHGQFPQPQLSQKRPSSGIVDLRTAPSTESKPVKCGKPKTLNEQDVDDILYRL